MESGVEHHDLRDGRHLGQRRADAQDIGRIVQRRQIVVGFDLGEDRLGDDDGSLEGFAAMHHPVADGLHRRQPITLGQDAQQHIQRGGMTQAVQGFGLFLLADLGGDTGIRLTQTFGQTGHQRRLVAGRKQGKLQGGAAAIDHKDQGPILRHDLSHKCASKGREHVLGQVTMSPREANRARAWLTCSAVGVGICAKGYSIPRLSHLCAPI